MDEAVKVCKEIIGLYPGRYSCLRVLGMDYAQRDLFKEAMHLAEQAIRIESEIPTFGQLMALTYAISRSDTRSE